MKLVNAIANMPATNQFGSAITIEISFINTNIMSNVLRKFPITNCVPVQSTPMIVCIQCDCVELIW